MAGVAGHSVLQNIHRHYLNNRIFVRKGLPATENSGHGREKVIPTTTSLAISLAILFAIVNRENWLSTLYNGIDL
jgi:hypothetical protein